MTSQLCHIARHKITLHSVASCTVHVEKFGAAHYWHCCWSLAMSADNVCQCKRWTFWTQLV